MIPSIRSERGARLLVAAMKLQPTAEEPRVLKAGETLLHAAADSFVPKLSVTFRYAFAMGRKAVRGELRTAGGPGSGNFGHAGRPGQVGGSASAFGTSDPYVYHISNSSLLLNSFEQSGIKPSKTGQDGPGVYMANTPEATQYYEDLSEGRLFRIDKEKLIERFGKYPENKDGIEYDDHTGEVKLGGLRAVPREFIEVKDNGKWRALGLRFANLDAVTTAMRMALNAVLPGMLAKVLVAGGQVALDGFQLKAAEVRAAADGPLRIRFDLRNPVVIAWAKKHAAELIDNITDTTKDRIRLAVEELQEDGDWDFYHDRIMAAIGDEARADLIARHETMLAAGEGQRQGWDQAVEAGLLDDSVKRVWIVTPDERLCPICSELEDKIAPLNGEYPGGFEGPPAHVQCRCTEGING